jgi:hypothetical protein
MISHTSGDDLHCAAAHAADSEGFEICIRDRLWRGEEMGNAVFPRFDRLTDTLH